MSDETQDKKNIIRQLNVVKGQIEGIKKMFEEEQDCVAIITQLKAVKNGINRVGTKMISKKFKECLLSSKKNAITDKELESILLSLSKY